MSGIGIDVGSVSDVASRWLIESEGLSSCSRYCRCGSGSVTDDPPSDPRLSASCR